MDRSRFMPLIGFALSMCLAVAYTVADIVHRILDPVADFFHLDHSDHRASLALDRAAHDLEAIPILSRFKAFAKRALDHTRFVGGGFSLSRSTFA